MPRTDPLNKTPPFAVLASIFIIVAALYFAQDVLIPLALATLLSFLLTPVVMRLERAKMGRIASVVLVTLAIIAIVFTLGTAVYIQIADLANDLPQYRDNIRKKVEAFVGVGNGPLDRIGEVVKDVEQAVAKPATTQAAEPTEAEKKLGMTEPAKVPDDLSGERARRASEVDLPGTSPDKPLWTQPIDEDRSPLESMGEYLAVVAGPLGTAGLVIVFTFFMLLQREDLRDRVIRLVGQGQLNITTQALDDAASRISRYLLAQAIVNGTYGIAISIGLYIIGATLGDQIFPNFILWGLLCALLRFIPYIGPWIAAIFPLLVAFAVFQGYNVFIATCILFVVIELLSNNFMEPWLYGSSTGMSTVAVLVSAVFWTWLWGPIGLILATPMTVCLVVIGKYVPQLSFFGILLSDEPVLSPPERIYQRMLALDQEEAVDVMHEYLDEMTLEQAFDNVLLPALAMAEQDRHRGRLDERRQRFVRQSMRYLIEEAADAARQRDTQAATKAVVEASRGLVSDPEKAGDGKAKLVRTRLPKECVINIVNLPAHDEADEIVGLMLQTLLETSGYCVFNVSTTALAGEMIEAVAKHRADIVCVSALPPSAVSHARYLCKRLHATQPDMKMVVGLWTVSGDMNKAKDRITCVASVQLVTTLSAAITQIQQMAQPLLLEREQTRV